MQKLTEAELEILQILWKEGSSTVRTVNEALNTQREVGYTTTLKMMQLMFEKGLVKRDESQRTHTYTANISEDVTQKNLVDKLMQSVFGGSAMKLVMQALGNKKASQEEIKAIRQLLDQIEKEKGGNQ